MVISSMLVDSWIARQDHPRASHKLTLRSWKVERSRERHSGRRDRILRQEGMWTYTLFIRYN